MRALSTIGNKRSNLLQKRLKFASFRGHLDKFLQVHPLEEHGLEEIALGDHFHILAIILDAVLALLSHQRGERRLDLIRVFSDELALLDVVNLALSADAVEASIRDAHNRSEVLVIFDQSVGFKRKALTITILSFI